MFNTPINIYNTMPFWLLHLYPIIFNFVIHQWGSWQKVHLAVRESNISLIFIIRFILAWLVCNRSRGSKKVDFMLLLSVVSIWNFGSNICNSGDNTKILYNRTNFQKTYIFAFIKISSFLSSKRFFFFFFFYFTYML